MRYYVYVHRRADTHDIFYVGKGSNPQRLNDLSGRNQHWKRVVAKHGFTAEVVARFPTNELAMQYEIMLIAHYGRKNLVNLTDGGEGCCGLAPGPETRQKLSALASRPRTEAWVRSIRIARKDGGNGGVVKRGDKLSASWKANIALTKLGTLNPMHGVTGADHPTARPVIHLLAGVYYYSVEDAAAVFGYKMKTLYNWLSGHRKNPTPLEFA